MGANRFSVVRVCVPLSFVYHIEMAVESVQLQRGDLSFSISMEDLTVCHGIVYIYILEYGVDLPMSRWIYK